jgi:hypothetical protein
MEALDAAMNGRSSTTTSSPDFPALGMLPPFVSEFACFWLSRKFQ